jgi:hypothetical protein
MSDCAFKTAAFPAYTTKELERSVKENPLLTDAQRNKMRAELERRMAVAAGDVSVMTDGERLRFAKTGTAR